MTEAEIALHTAWSFTRDILAGLQRQNPDDFQDLLNTTALAAKQIQAAEKIDPAATITIKRDDDSDFQVDIAFLKVLCLLYEGEINVRMGSSKRAVPILRQALHINPDFDPAWYWLAIAYGDLLDKGDAIDAINNAIRIDPQNIEYRKALERAKSISAGQVVLDRTSSAASGFLTFLNWCLGLYWVLIIIMCIYIYNKESAFGAIFVFVVFALIGAGLNWIVGKLNAARDALR